VVGNVGPILAFPVGYLRGTKGAATERTIYRNIPEDRAPSNGLLP